MNRMTGCLMSGALYIYGAAYLVAPLMNWHIESATLAAAFASWPFIAKVATKTMLALPFTFHSFNGVRHLVWDFGKQMTNRQVIVTGWTVIGLSSVSALWLAFL